MKFEPGKLYKTRYYLVSTDDLSRPFGNGPAISKGSILMFLEDKHYNTDMAVKGRWRRVRQYQCWWLTTDGQKIKFVLNPNKKVQVQSVESFFKKL